MPIYQWHCAKLYTAMSYKSPLKEVNYKSNRTKEYKEKVIETKNKNVSKITNYTFPKHG